jgi:hypothetical protein
MQDNVDADEAVRSGVLGYTLDGFGSYRTAHAPRHLPPGLVRHFIYITV